MNNTKNRITIDHHITDRAGCSLAITAAASSSRRRRWGCYSRAYHSLLYRPRTVVRVASIVSLVWRPAWPKTPWQKTVGKEGGCGLAISAGRPSPSPSPHPPPACSSSFFCSALPCSSIQLLSKDPTPPLLAIVVVVIVQPSSVARRSSSPGVLPPELRLKGDYQPARARSNTTSMETSPNDYTTPLSTTLLPPTTCAPTHRQSLPHQHRGHQATAAAICRIRGAALVLAAESSQ